MTETAAPEEPAPAGGEPEKDPLAPSVYSVHVKHGWDGLLEIEVKDVKMDEANSREAVAWALRHVADMVERGESHMHRKPGNPPNVVSLRGGDFDCVKAKSAEPDAALVKRLAVLTLKAREGELRSFIGTGFTAAGMRASCFGGAIGADVYQMLGAIAWLQHEYVDRMLGRADVPSAPEPKGAS